MQYGTTLSSEVQGGGENVVISLLCLEGAGGEDGKLVIFCKGSRDHFLYKSDIISLYQQSNNTAPLIEFLSAFPSEKINAKSRNHNSAIQTNKLTIFWTGSVTSVVCTTLVKAYRTRQQQLLSALHNE